MLRGERVLLRGKRREDLPVQFEHDNDLEVLLVADDGPPVPWPLERLYRSFDRQAEESDDSHTWFVIEVEGKVIGRCGLSRFHLTDRTCFLGIVIGEKEYWGRGYGREAIRLLLDYAYRYRNMRKVYLSTGSHNERAPLLPRVRLRRGGPPAPAAVVCRRVYRRSLHGHPSRGVGCKGR